MFDAEKVDKDEEEDEVGAKEAEEGEARDAGEALMVRGRTCRRRQCDRQKASR